MGSTHASLDCTAPAPSAAAFCLLSMRGDAADLFTQRLPNTTPNALTVVVFVSNHQTNQLTCTPSPLLTLQNFQPRKDDEADRSRRHGARRVCERRLLPAQPGGRFRSPLARQASDQLLLRPRSDAHSPLSSIISLPLPLSLTHTHTHFTTYDRVRTTASTARARTVAKTIVCSTRRTTTVAGTTRATRVTRLRTTTKTTCTSSRPTARSQTRSKSTTKARMPTSRSSTP
jgi:hypothetical protein